MFKPSDVASQLNVSPNTVRLWSRRFSDFLSAAAQSSRTEKGTHAQRRYSQDDLKIFYSVKGYLNENKTYEEIIELLATAGTPEVLPLPMQQLSSDSSRELSSELAMLPAYLERHLALIEEQNKLFVQMNEKLDRSVTAESADVNRRLSRYLIDEGLRLESSERPIGGHGYFDYGAKPQKIVIRKTSDLDPLGVQRTKTLAHEAAHYLTQEDVDLMEIMSTTERQRRELIAESSAFVTMHHYGMDTSEYSFKYLATWGADRQALRHDLHLIQQTAKTLIHGIDGVTNPYIETEWDALDPQNQPQI